MRIVEIISFLEEEKIPFSFSGHSEASVESFSSLARYKAGTFTWIKQQESIPDGFDVSQIALAFAPEDITGNFRNIIHTPQSKRAFFSVIEHFYSEKNVRPPVGKFTYISPNVKLGENVRIGHNCTLDGDITVDDDTVIWNCVTIINRVSIGKNCDIRSGVVIGHDGFGYTEDAAHRKTMIKHVGGVLIGDNVLIGENACISRGTIDDTILESGVKIDSLSHIAHNCHFRKNAVAAAPCRTNGSVTVGENAYLAGALVRNQCTIGENAFIGLGSVVVSDIAPNQIVIGNPAKLFTKKD